MSVRDSIFSGLVTRLEAVKTGNGYASNVALVYRNALPAESVTIKDGHALVSLFDDGKSATIQKGASNRLLKEARYVIRAKIQGTRMGLTPTQLADNWDGDMEELAYNLNATPSLLHANVCAVEMDAYAGWNVSETDAIIAVPFLVLFWFDQTAP